MDVETEGLNDRLQAVCSVSSVLEYNIRKKGLYEGSSEEEVRMKVDFFRL